MSNVENSFSETEISRIKDRVNELVRENLASRNFYLLSKLGLDLGEDRKNLESMGMTVLHFVQTHTSHKIAKHGSHQNIYGILRPDVNVEDIGPKKRRRRYKRQFWAAFIYGDIPAARFLNLENLRFSADEAEAIAYGGRVLSIAPEYQTQWSDPRKREQAETKVRAWIDANGLDPEQFYEAEIQRDSTGRWSLLDEVLATLTEDQRKRTKFSLDVINALQKKIR